MKPHIFVLALALSAAPWAQAQTVPGSYLDAVDADANGAVTPEELMGLMAQAYSALDADGDGAVSWSEAEVTMTRPLFDGADADANASLSQAEFMAQVERDFAAADRDGDGALD